MLMSTQANRYAHQLLDVRANAQLIPPLSLNRQLSIADGYDIAKSIMNARIAEGEVMIGRKLGFTNRAIWSKYGIEGPGVPTWSPVFDTTVRYTEDNRGVQSLAGAVQPRIEPELAFKLGKTPEPDSTLEGIADCIEWMAHAFEIVVSPFPGWKFDVADSIAAFGLHGLLIIGEVCEVSATMRRHLGKLLAGASVSLSCGDELRTAGFGNNLLGSPLHALRHLHQMLKKQPQFAPLCAGEIITTGAWTEAHPIAPGETWVSAFSGVNLPGLVLSFV